MKCSSTSYLHCVTVLALSGFLFSVNALAQLDAPSAQLQSIRTDLVTSELRAVTKVPQQTNKHLMTELAVSLAVSTEPKPTTGRIRLIATRGNHPIFDATHWLVYRLEQGIRRPVGEYERHTRQLDLLPGVYEAVAQSNEIVRARKFWVRGDTTHNVILAMD